MTDIVITESYGTVVAEVQDTQTVVVEGTSGSIVVTGIMGPSGSSSAAINNLLDVDVTQLNNGALLVYSAQTQKWTATKVLQEQTIECGQF